MRFLLSEKSPNQLNHDVYNEHSYHYLREVSSDPPDEATEILNELETSDEPIGQEVSTDEVSSTSEAIGTTSDHMYQVDETSSYVNELTTTMADAGGSDSPSESSQTILIILGVLLAVLVIVCCVLACIFARIRRKGFCTVEGKNQANCDEDCEQEAMSLQQQSPKESMSSGKSANSRSSDKLLTK